MKKLLFVLSAMVMALPFTYAQNIRIEDKDYQTVKKTTLNSETEFVKLKPTGKQSNGESYIRVNNEYYRTSLNAESLKTFFTTGKLSSLGTVKKSKIAGKSIMYIDNGSSLLILSYKQETIGFIDIQDDKIVANVRTSLAKAANDNGGGGTTGDPLLDCGVECLNAYITCGNSEACSNAYKKCWGDCKNRQQTLGGSGSPFSIYSLSLSNVSVKL